MTKSAFVRTRLWLLRPGRARIHRYVLLLISLPAVCTAGADPADPMPPSPAEAVCPVDSLKTPADPDSLASRIVDEALSWVGTPYVYGGTGPSGFDCSGLVYRVFTDNGVPVPRTVGDIERLGEAVAKDDLMPGDLVFFDNPRHIGIFVGNGEFVHSSSYLDRGVVVTSLGQPNYARRYSTARRVI